MKKIPTIFRRDPHEPALVTSDWMPECEWVRDGEGVATRKWDGSACLIRYGKLYKRRELRAGDVAPVEFEAVGFDELTGKTVGWVPVSDSPEDRWHREAYGLRVFDEGTYELVGPKVNANRDEFEVHTLVPHGRIQMNDAPRTFDELHVWLTVNPIEGLVWWHPDGRMAKIKRRDFGLKW